MDFILYFGAESLSPICNSLEAKVPAFSIRYFSLSRSQLQLQSISNVHVLFHQSPIIYSIYFINHKTTCMWCSSCHDFIISSSVPFAAVTSIFISKRWTFLSVTERLPPIVIGKRSYWKNTSISRHQIWYQNLKL